MTGRESFDYVIVGAGSAGCVLAARLSEDPSARVLLLEAGPRADVDEVRIPAAFWRLFKTRWDWKFATVEQKHLAGRRIDWPRMKAVGGCSAMNAMIYIRGNRVDYDAWRDEYGATGWGYADVLPYFIRSEANTRLGAPYHGRSGPVHVEDRRYTHELSQAWVQTAVGWGLEATDDFNGVGQQGAGLYQVTCKAGRRWSCADGYLDPVLDRENLVVRSGAQATRVMVDGGRATGVAYRHRGVDRSVHADVEVLLAGGAVNSPQLLLLSGIGPAAHLQELGIPVVVDLPVGENLHDHPVVPLMWHTRGTSDLFDYTTLARLAQWRLFGRGPLTSNLAEAGAFFATRPGLSAPDLQVHMGPTGFYDNGLREPTARMITTGATLVAVASRGRLRLASTNPFWRPEIDAGYFTDPVDLDAMLAGCRSLLEIAEQAPLRQWIDRPFLPCTGHNSSDEELLAHIRDLTQTLYHPVGTCAMGTGQSAVVDPMLRVRGIERLRVVDASVMPAAPRGNTQAPTVMIAEKGADLIRGVRPLPSLEVTR